MIIDLYTTKIKLSKSIINQLQFAGIEEFKDCKVLGYLENVRKNYKRLILLEKNKLYYITPADYRKTTYAVIRFVDRHKFQKVWETEEECENFWKSYKKVVEKAVKQIFI